MWIRTKDGWYVRAIHGTCFIVWVSSDDKANAMTISKDKVEPMLALLKSWTGKDLEAIDAFV